MAASTQHNQIEIESNKSTASRSQVQKSEDCPHCSDGAESFQYFGGAYKFDVDLAREIVLDGRESVELTPDDVKYSVDMSRIYPEHLAHVDTQYPGIISHVWGPGEQGSWLHGHLLIDGHHRAARCLQLGIPFYVYLLNEEESVRIVAHGPTSVRPVQEAEKKTEKKQTIKKPASRTKEVKQSNRKKTTSAATKGKKPRKRSTANKKTTAARGRPTLSKTK